MLNHLIRGLLFHYKKVLFCFNFIWKGCFKKMHHLFFRVRANDVNSTKSQPKIFIWWINKMTSDKRWQAKFSGIVLRWKQLLSFKNCRSVRICSVLNRSNRDTTVYYRLIFCAFSWPNMVKWHHSGIINLGILALKVKLRSTEGKDIRSTHNTTSNSIRWGLLRDQWFRDSIATHQFSGMN